MNLLVSDLSLSFEAKEVLKNIDFYLEEGDWLGILGPNGAGKTSLLKSILQVNEDYRGSITFNNQNIKALTSKERGKLMSYVPQANNEFSGSFTVKEILYLSRYPYMDSFLKQEKYENEKANEILELFNLTLLKDKPFQILSGGEKQRVLLASSLFQDTKIILMDEPSSFLDPAHMEDFIQNLRKIKKMGKSVILVTHDINLAYSLTEKLLLLKNGESQFFGDTNIVGLENLKMTFDKTFEEIQVKGNSYILPVDYYKNE